MSGEETVLLTVLLRHDQGKNLHEIQATLGEREWWTRFPPGRSEVVSWVVAMGVGQIVTLRVPASELALVNVELERSAWGVFETEFYPTYDFVPVRERLTREWRASRGHDAPDDVPHAGPARAETVRAETVRAETVRAETVRAETVRAETVRAESVPEAPRPGMFSNGKRVGDRFVLSGMHAGTGEGGTYEQARRALAKIKALVEAAGGTMDDVLALRVYLTDIADKAEVGRARAEFFTGDFPCSTLVEVSRLAEPGLTVEIEAEGVIGSSGR
ncbi:RidA family protein [Actinomadura sediminis]|uniref:RidA family protein n=1 Tax=Actinomadura sediminis TaxID=1038904 RepID=A0ABW3EMY0_9ACTN